MDNIRAFIRKEIKTILKEEKTEILPTTTSGNRQISPDAAALNKLTAANKSLQTAQKRISNLDEFEDALKPWIQSLQLDATKFTLTNVRDRVVKVLQQLGYK